MSVSRAADGLQGPAERAELMRLNSYFSWNSPTFPCSRSFEKLSVSTNFSSSATRPTMRVRLITSSPTVFIMRSSRDSAMRTDLAAAATGALAVFLTFVAAGAVSSAPSGRTSSEPGGTTKLPSLPLRPAQIPQFGRAGNPRPIACSLHRPTAGAGSSSARPRIPGRCPQRQGKARVRRHAGGRSNLPRGERSLQGASIPPELPIP